MVRGRGTVTLMTSVRVSWSVARITAPPSLGVSGTQEMIAATRDTPLIVPVAQVMAPVSVTPSVRHQEVTTSAPQPAQTEHTTLSICILGWQRSMATLQVTDYYDNASCVTSLRSHLLPEEMYSLVQVWTQHSWL